MYIRKFKDSDAVEVARLHRATIRNINSKDYSKKQIEAWSNRVSAKRFRDSAKNCIRFVALDNNKIIGFADFKENDLMGLYIHKDCINKGIGKNLLTHLEKAAYKKGVRKLQCLSTITARKFYEKNRYKILKKTRHKIKNQNLIVYEMEKKLNRM